MKRYVLFEDVRLIFIKDASFRMIWHVTLWRFMFRVSTRRWWKPKKFHSYFYGAKAVQFGPFTFYWRLKEKS